MPRCAECSHSTPSLELRPGIGEYKRKLVCSRCGRPLRLVEEEPVPKNKKKLFSVDVFEFDTEDGGKDHSIEVHGGYGGLNIQFETTVDQVRKFFAEKREAGEKAKLKAVQ